MAATELGPRVLVVDDEDSFTELGSMALRYEGFQVQTASSGYGALEKIKRRARCVVGKCRSTQRLPAPPPSDDELALRASLRDFSSAPGRPPNPVPDRIWGPLRFVPETGPGPVVTPGNYRCRSSLARDHIGRHAGWENGSRAAQTPTIGWHRCHHLSFRTH